MILQASCQPDRLLARCLVGRWQACSPLVGSCRLHFFATGQLYKTLMLGGEGEGKKIGEIKRGRKRERGERRDRDHVAEIR